MGCAGRVGTHGALGTAVGGDRSTEWGWRGTAFGGRLVRGDGT